MNSDRIPNRPERPGAAVAAGGFLSQLDAESSALLRARVHRRSYAKGAFVLDAEDQSFEFYLILEGRAVASLYGADGKVVSYRDIGPGDIFGELSALDGLPRSAFVIAETDLVAGVLSPEELGVVLDTAPGFGRSLMKHLCAQVRQVTSRLFELRTLLVRERLISELLRRALPPERQTEAWTVPAMPTHFELAAHIGTHREAVSKELGDLVREGLIIRRGKLLLIPSVSALEEKLRERFG